MKLVIVESPTKAKTISKFLGKGYMVTSCMGHVRDLPSSAKDIPEKYKKQSWAHLGVDVNNEFSPIYCIPKNKTKVIKELKQSLSKAEELILATDEDREGESISWHLLEILSPKVPVKRMVFHEITKNAIQKALKNFRGVNNNLVEAQEARRVIDRLVGYTISPLLWKKISYGLSAGRVQSVAMKLITEREFERIVFKRVKYSGLSATFEKDKKEFQGHLISYQSKKIAIGKDFDSHTGKLLEKSKNYLWLSEKKSQDIVKAIEGEKAYVESVEKKPVFKKPPSPFITSTLQQEANRKLKWSAKETMSVAQKLYERGLITYMRTDSTFLSKESIQGTRDLIKKLYGNQYLPQKPRDHTRKKSKGAQEAHEAIRPAGSEFKIPDASGLRGSSLELYSLIFKRTLACQMKEAEQKQVSVKIKKGESLFSATGLTTEFDGFLRVYDMKTERVVLPKMNFQQEVDTKKLEATSHETKPPARFTEASLIQKLEKEGVGRPSTYAPIISTIQERGYVKKEGNILFPTFTAIAVARFLKQYLPDYVDLNFTSKMEESLDEIAKGHLNRTHYLSGVYFGENGLKEKVDFQEKNIEPEEARKIEMETIKDISIRIGRYGAYICRQEKEGEVCASLPENLCPEELTMELAHKIIDQKLAGNDSLGQDPKTGDPIFALSGRFGPYVQRGDSSDSKNPVKRVSLPPQWQLEDVDLKKALWLIDLPKVLGICPKTKKEIKLGIGRFGPFVVCNSDFRSIPKVKDIMSVDLNWALETFSKEKIGRRSKKIIQELGFHPRTEEKVQVMTGRYGDYLRCGKVNVSLPEDQNPKTISLHEALKLLGEKLVVKKKPRSARKKLSPSEKKPKVKKNKTSVKVIRRKRK